MKCSCPYQYDERTGGSVRAGLDQFCALHGTESHPQPHCATCRCFESAQVPIVQTPEIAAQQVARDPDL